MAMNAPQTLGTAMGAVLIAIVDYRILVDHHGRRHRRVCLTVAARRIDVAAVEAGRRDGCHRGGRSNP